MAGRAGERGPAWPSLRDKVQDPVEDSRIMHAPPLVCHSCRAAGLLPILSLGKTPLANRLLDAEQLQRPEPRHPLNLAMCRRCTLLQITEAIPPEQLFRDYVYFSSYADTAVVHAQRLTAQLISQRRLGKSSLVVEVASNDGYLLRHYRQAGIPVQGVEPAANVAAVAEREHGIPTWRAFFDRSLARQIRQARGPADVVHGHNVLAHVANLNGFVAGLRHLLKPSGIIVIEVPYVRDLIDSVQFDTIYHEHRCYFSLTALDHLARRNGLLVMDVERIAIHGGSLRLVLGRQGNATSARVAELRNEEAAWGIGSAGAYRRFGKRVDILRHDLRTILERLKSQGMRIAAYGASAKGSTLLNYCGISSATIDFVVDRNPVKQQRYTPGTRLKIYDPSKLLSEQPDYVLLLTWNFADEILQQQADYRRQGGRFIIPVPRIRVA